MRFNFKDQLITTALDGEALLRSGIATLNDPALTVESFTYRGIAFLAKSLNACALNLDIGIDSGVDAGVTIRSLMISDIYSGNGLGLASAKAAIGVAYEQGEKSVRLFLVCCDGPSFWPTLGATPIEEPEWFGYHLKNVLEEEASSLSRAEFKTLSHIAKTVDTDLLSAWRALSQTTTRLPSGRYLKQEVFNRSCSETDLMFDLTDAQTLSILTHRLGRLPEFPVVANRSAPCHSVPALAYG